MTTSEPRLTFADERVPSFANIQKRIRSSDHPTIVKARPQLLTSMNRLVRHADLDPAVTPFVPRVAQAALSQITPTTSGLSKKSIQNDWSNIRSLLNHFGLGGLKQYRVQLTDEYARLYERIEDRHLRAGVSRLFRFAQFHQIPLAEVDDEFVGRFHRALRQEGVERDPTKSWRTALRSWNKLRLRYPKMRLQEFTIPMVRRGWALPWDAFPASLVSEVEGYFVARSVEGDLFDPDAPEVVLRPRTIETQKDWLRTLASAAVRSGMETSSISSLRDLVRPATVESGLKWFLEEHGANRTEYVVMLCVQAVTVAKSLPGSTKPDIERLSHLVTRLRRHVAATRKEPTRLDRLAQFESRRNRLKMLALSEHVVKTVRRSKKPSRSDALSVQLALAHELMLVTSLRRANIVGLNLEQHFIWPDGPGGDRCLIRIPGREVKNGETLHKELPEHVLDLLRLYLKAWRPLLTDRSSPWLFHGRDDGHKKPSTFTYQYRRFILTWTGLDVTPHLLRSFGDMVYSDRYPEGGEVMRRQLGHRSPETRLKYYADPRSRAAGRAYQALLLEERNESLSQPALFGKRRQSRRTTVHRKPRS